MNGVSAVMVEDQSLSTAETLVVVLPWLGASSDVLQKYLALYRIDVCETFVHYSRLKDFLWPKAGLEYSLVVLDEIKRKAKDKKAIIIHAFSVGCYFYSLMIRQMRLQPWKYAEIWRKISAQVLDSPVVGSTSEMAVGVAKMVTQQPLVASLLKSLCLGYFALTYPYTVFYYNQVVAEVKFYSPKVPSLLMGSKGDPLMNLQALEEVRNVWKKSRYVIYRVWRESNHAQHLKFYPSEYAALIQAVLRLSENHISLQYQPVNPMLPSKL